MARVLVKEIKDNRKNYLINGDMRISQRGTSFSSISSGVYSLDRMIYNKTGGMIQSITQDTDVPTFAQSNYNFVNSIRLSLNTPDTSIAIGDFTQIGQSVEGYNWANLAQKPFTLSFWVKATLPGIYCVSFINSGSDRSYVAEYTINAVSTWEYKTITVSASPTAGTWDYSNGVGLRVRWALAAGLTFQTAANTWATGNYFATSNQVNGVNTGANDFRLTGITLNEGSAALPFTLFGRDFEGELSACQRYAQSSFPSGTAWAQAAGVTGAEYTRFTGSTNLSMSIQFPTQMRASPSITTYNPISANSSARNTDNNVDVPFVDVAGGTTHRSHIVAFNSGTVAIYRWHYSADAEL